MKRCLIIALLLLIALPAFAYNLDDLSSRNLVLQAWKALANREQGVVHYAADKCIELYSKEADKQQRQLRDFAPRDKAFEYWALNDVATAYFIKGESYAAEEKYREAKTAFRQIMRHYKFAQCWDPQGWFWKVAEAARERIKQIEDFEGGVFN